MSNELNIPNADNLPPATVHELREHFVEVFENNTNILKKGISRPRHVGAPNFVPHQLRDMQIVNYGMPAQNSEYDGINASKTEIDVLDMMRPIWGHKNNETVSYVASGSSISNLQAIYSA